MYFGNEYFATGTRLAGVRGWSAGLWEAESDEVMVLGSLPLQPGRRQTIAPMLATWLHGRDGSAPGSSA